MARPRTSLENKIVRGTGQKPTDMSEEACANWRLSQSRSLTPVMNHDGSTSPVRRILYKLLRGPLCDRERLESTCGNILCVNPHHAQIEGVMGVDLN